MRYTKKWQLFYYLENSNIVINKLLGLYNKYLQTVCMIQSSFYFPLYDLKKMEINEKAQRARRPEICKTAHIYL